jgi:hypothetical protein
MESLVQLVYGQQQYLLALCTCRFANVEEVEVLARVERKWDEDGLPDQEASDLGELILKVGLMGCCCCHTIAVTDTHQT